MSLRLEMLQVARLAPRQLGEARDLVAAFVRGRLNPDGGFADRSGVSDLYYTVFGVDALIALQEEPPVERTATFLHSRLAGELDVVHAGCLARVWASLRRAPDDAVVDALLARIEGCRTADGGYSTFPGASEGSTYGAYIAMAAYQDLGRPMPDPDAVLASLRGLRAADGSYGNVPGLVSGLTTATAAAVMVRKHLGDPADRDAGMWLLDRCHSGGGFFAMPGAPIPDLLSTATALHALAALRVPIQGLREPCLDFVDSLWTNRGGFYGNWTDEEIDCEYTYYALLALGHLSVDA